LCSDDKKFGGQGRIKKRIYKTYKKPAHGVNNSIEIALPAFCGVYLIKN
jgi:hypothetical protein